MNRARHFAFPYRDLPVSVGAPDTIEATARNSRTARMTSFMIVLLSGQQTECCGKSPRRKLYRELLGGSRKWNIQYLLYVLFLRRLFGVLTEQKIRQRNGVILEGEFAVCASGRASPSVADWALNVPWSTELNQAWQSMMLISGHEHDA